MKKTPELSSMDNLQSCLWEWPYPAHYVASSAKFLQADDATELILNRKHWLHVEEYSWFCNPPTLAQLNALFQGLL